MTTEDATTGVTANKQEGGTEETHSLQDDDLAQEIGLNAYEYLEECFYNEVSVLDRDKFDAIPEVVKSNLTILGHLGKGSFSDVFEVVWDGELDGKMGFDVPSGQQSSGVSPSAPGAPADSGRRRSSRRRNNLGSSFSSRTFLRPSQLGDPQQVFAMKCLRPQIRSDVDQFTIGSEDLVHETAILANLSHEHVIQLHGRASGCLTDAFVLNDGYFILLDKLHDTLQDRIHEWRDANGDAKAPQAKQIEVARDIADAVVYLHSKKIVFRDLKPANVGFDEQGVLKLFDFGFACGLPTNEVGNPDCLLYDRCGTPRYMAPEVGLSCGYGLESDLYSFGILLWEICSLTKPFSSITSAGEFHRAVFSGGERPPVGAHWPKAVTNLMVSCWAAHPSKRPSIVDVRSSLAAATNVRSGRKSAIKQFRSSMTKRFSL